MPPKPKKAQPSRRQRKSTYFNVLNSFTDKVIQAARKPDAAPKPKATAASLNTDLDKGLRRSPRKQTVKVKAGVLISSGEEEDTGTFGIGLLPSEFLCQQAEQCSANKLQGRNARVDRRDESPPRLQTPPPPSPPLRTPSLHTPPRARRRSVTPVSRHRRSASIGHATPARPRFAEERTGRPRSASVINEESPQKAQGVDYDNLMEWDDWADEIPASVDREIYAARARVLGQAPRGLDYMELSDEDPEHEEEEDGGPEWTGFDQEAEEVQAVLAISRSPTPDPPRQVLEFFLTISLVYAQLFIRISSNKPRSCGEHLGHQMRVWKPPKLLQLLAILLLLVNRPLRLANRLLRRKYIRENRLGSGELQSKERVQRVHILYPCFRDSRESF